MGNRHEGKLDNTALSVIALSIIGQNPGNYALNHPLCKNPQVRAEVEKLLSTASSDSSINQNSKGT